MEGVLQSGGELRESVRRPRHGMLGPARHGAQGGAQGAAPGAAPQLEGISLSMSPTATGAPYAGWPPGLTSVDGHAAGAEDSIVVCAEAQQKHAGLARLEKPHLHAGAGAGAGAGTDATGLARADSDLISMV